MWLVTYFHMIVTNLCTCDSYVHLFGVNKYKYFPSFPYEQIKKTTTNRDKGLQILPGEMLVLMKLVSPLLLCYGALVVVTSFPRGQQAAAQSCSPNSVEHPEGWLNLS